MNDKNPIAKADKTLILFILIMGIIGISLSFNVLRNFSLRWFGIFFISTNIFIVLWGIAMFAILPNHVIVQENEKIIVYQSVFKKIISLYDIIKVEIAPLQKEEKEKKNGVIILTVKKANGEEEEVQVSVQDKKQVVERIKEIIQSVAVSPKSEPAITQNIE